AFDRRLFLPSAVRCPLSAGALTGARIERQHEGALGHAIALLHRDHLDDARRRGRNIHRRLLRLERDERRLELDAIARLYEHVDHFDVFEVANVGNEDVCSHTLLGSGLPLAISGKNRSTVSLDVSMRTPGSADAVAALRTNRKPPSANRFTPHGTASSNPFTSASCSAR